MAEAAFRAALAAELANAVAGPAVQLAVAIRIEQIVVNGHDREADSMLALDRLPRQAREFLVAATEQITGVGEKRNLCVARKNLARTAAMCLAAMDRLDLAIKAQPGELEL